MISVYVDPERMERLQAWYAAEEQFILQNGRPPTTAELLELRYENTV